MSVFWRPSLGLLSVSADGTVLVADTTGAATWTIQDAAGPRAMVASADLSFEHEQLAVAGNRVVSLWQCISQTQVGVLDTAEMLRSPVLLVRYLPSQLHLVTVHEGDGAVFIWDAARLQLHRAVWVPPAWPMPPRASCAAWVPQRPAWGDAAKRGAGPPTGGGGSLFIFGADGLTERQLCEVEVQPAAAVAAQSA